MHKIENDLLTVTAKEKGAELDSIFHKKNQLEYLWKADPKFWNKKSPVLFPIVGALKDNTYFLEGNSYQLHRHGFAREMEFELEKHDANEMTFLLGSDDKTLAVYPFDFEFRITYTLQKNALHVTYDVLNTGMKDMYFSVGGHPAFAVPLVNGTAYEDYFLEFENEEDADRLLLTPEGLIDGTEKFLENENQIPLTKQLFYNDAIVLRNLQSGMVSLLSDKTEHGLNFYFDGFPYLGIWAFHDADFVCIEPWCGIADSVDHSELLKGKEGINALAAGKSFRVVWSVECF
jgi:galactose mutarotase-like enzyme